MPSNTPRASKAQERDAALKQALVLRAQQAKRARRSKIIAISALVVAIAVLAVVVTMILRQAKPGAEDLDAEDPLKGVTAPAGATGNGGITVGADGAAGTTSGDGAVDLTIYFDYMCSFCGKFEIANADMIDELTAAGDITVEYHPLGFLDRFSQGTNYSTRSAQAVAYVADADPSHFVALHQALFEDQPEENTPGFTDEEIAELAVGVGVPQAVADEIETGTFTTWVTAASAQAVLDEISGTPTVFINGEKTDVDLYTDGPLEEAIRAAIG